MLQSGLRQAQPVAIWADRTPEMILAVLGVMRAGGCVVPIDPRHPRARIDAILRDAEPLALFAADPAAASAAGVDPAWIRPIRPDDLPDVDADLPLPAPEDASYILYTSGTTGVPKGVVQTHAMLDNLIGWQLSQPGTPKRVLQFASLAFDVAFQEIFSAICGGATLVLMPVEAQRDVANLGQFLQDHRIERAFLPAAVLHVLQAPGRRQIHLLAARSSRRARR
ncbi:AMP-binding protein [Sulfitobacter albidus]|uniref:AMP-binding protein n=1 Tax=Sulfitobacter albidus TaxID=2829501 RepID=A0A975PP27_9RHOB|nr:AMP-binding protein [Sulfitobacter albidus]